MMTLDKFGRHLVKNPQLVLTKFSDKEILSSSYMFYNVILKFEANAIVDNKYIIGFDRVDYKFPLEQGTIELNYQIQFGTSISFVVKQNRKLKTINLNVYLRR
jgi:hypothetical protein